MKVNNNLYYTWKMFSAKTKKSVGLKIFLAIVKAMFPLVMLSVLQNLIDGVTNQERVEYIAGGLLLYAVMASSSAVAGYFDARADLSLEEGLEISFLPKVLEKTARIEYACFEKSKLYDIVMRVKTGLKENLLLFVKSAANVVTSLLVVTGLFIYYLRLSIIFAITFIFVLFLIIYLDYKSISTMNSMINGQTTEERRMEYLESVLKDKSALAELRVFHATSYLTERWHVIAKSVLKKRFRKTIETQRYFLLSSLCLGVWISGLIGSTIYRTVTGYVSIGIAVAAIRSIATVLDAVENFSFKIYQVMDSHAKLKYMNLLREFPEGKSSEEERPDFSQPLEIVFNQVGFTYPGTDQPVLKKLTLKFRTDEKVALVGENGSGKSTIVKLLCGFYQVDEGSILINGIDINSLSRDSLCRLYSVVFQDFERYSFSLRENLTLGCKDAKWIDEDIYQLLRQCDFNKEIPLDAELGKFQENGFELSGGEWQKVAIARALAHDGVYLILDEPTASLDPVAESVLYQDFLNAMKNRGCVLISHRLASAKMCDRIVVLRNGEVAETGTHEELMKKKGFYYNMFEAQQSWYGQCGETG